MATLVPGHLQIHNEHQDQQKNLLAFDQERTFIFDKDLTKLLTTCYPLDVKDTAKGTLVVVDNSI